MGLFMTFESIFLQAPHKFSLPHLYPYYAYPFHSGNKHRFIESIFEVVRRIESFRVDYRYFARAYNSLSEPVLYHTMLR